MDVVLVQPNIVWAYDPFEHLGLAYLAAALRADGFSVDIIDGLLGELTTDQLLDELGRRDIGVLGVTLISHGYPQTVSFLERVRQAHPGTRIVAGGHFATFAADKIHAHTDVFDAIVLGEGERPFLHYCRNVLRGAVECLDDVCERGEKARRTGRSGYDLDELPNPARDLLSLALRRGAQASVTSSRGCYARCAFCSVPNFYRAGGVAAGWRPRSIPHVLAELAELHDRFRLSHFMFVDDNFIGPGKAGRQRAIEFAAAYKAAGIPMTFHIDCRAVDVDEEVIAALHDAGLRSVFVGVESVTAEDLLAYRKGVRAAKNWAAVEILERYELRKTLSMIMFNPETTPDAVLQNIAFLRWAEYYPRNPLSILNLYEGTDLLERYRAQVRGPFWDYRFNFACPQTRVVYEEAMSFCKGTLALERRLSRGDEAAARARTVLYRLRLGHLEDVAAHHGTEPAGERLARWRGRVDVLDSTMTAAGAPPAVPERRYLTGSFDEPADLRDETDVSS
ncbi:hypothetical protein GCM10009661_81740 [Catellatospora chokoriensis]|uniref:B12-binding domain-containing protein n=1 Tax=Catellatospora chokoriensis TaxID=310353 RepID=A0A8J3K6N0_9ACTN|nr:hypothetical protein Cch02nite_75850 [Catellatospora chokoriensis]